MSERYQSLDDVELRLVENVDDVVDFMNWLGQRREVLAVDTETGGLRWWSDALRLVQIGDARTGWAMAWGDWAGVVKEALARYDGPIVAHNMKFDLHYLEHNGVSLDRGRLHDTRILGHLLDPASSTGLKPMSARYIHPRATAGEALLKDAMHTQKWTWATVPVDFDPYWQYGALDTVLTARMYELLSPRVASRGLQGVYDLERGSTLVLANMERRGARVDRDYLRSKAQQLHDYYDQVGAWAETAYGIANINSNMQVADRLMADGWVPREHTPSGKPKLSEDVLETIDHPLAAQVLGARKARKIVSTYLEKIEDLAHGDVVHCSTNPLGARTGRMSISDPPLQQLPRGVVVRDAFIASEDHELLLADYDQMELRVFAYYAREEAMMRAAAEGLDLHTFIGSMVYSVPMEDLTKHQRQVTKGVDFGIPYGAGEATIAKTAVLPLDEVRAFLGKYHATFPGVKRFFKELEATARQRLAEEGLAYARTWAGRLQPAEPDKLYTLVNYLIQGGCADLLKQKLIDLDRSGLGDYFILPVHDEVILDVPKAIAAEVAAEVGEIMTERQVFDPVPLTAAADRYERWGDKYREDD